MSASILDIPLSSGSDLAAPSLNPSAPEWAGVPVLDIATPAGPPPHSGEGHFPRVSVRIRADEAAFHLLYTVEDEEGVQAVERVLNGQVWLDSTVEFFVRPASEARYVNVEINCLGIVHSSRVTDWRRDPETRVLMDRWILPETILSRLRIAHSIPDLPVSREGLPGKTSWALGYTLPYEMLSEAFEHPVRPRPGDVWHANFYKCADESRHPHWLSWSPMPRLAFHDPDNFGTLRFV